MLDPWLPRPHHPAPGALYGEGGALELAPSPPDPRRARHLPGRARERRHRRGRPGRRAPGGGGGARDVPAGNDPPLRDRPWLRGAARLALATGRARRPGLHRREREGSPPTKGQAGAASYPGDRARSDRGPTGTPDGRAQRASSRGRSRRRSRRRGSPTDHPPTSGTTALPPDPRTTRPSRSVCCFSWRTRRRGRLCPRGRCRRPNAAIRRSRAPTGGRTFRAGCGLWPSAPSPQPRS